MPKLGLTNSIVRSHPRRRILSGGGSTIPASGLSLWLKADAGVTSENYISYLVIAGFTGNYVGLNGAYEMLDPYEQSQPYLWNGSYFIYGNSITDGNDGAVIATNNNSGLTGAWTPTTYFSTITLSGAGTGSVNGVYTRADALEMELNPFVASGSRSIIYDEDNNLWQVNPNDSYTNYSFPTGTWATENGDAPAPAAVNSNSTRNLGSPTTSSRIITNAVSDWADQSVNERNAVTNNGFTSLTTIGANPFIEFNGGVDMYFSPIWEETPIVGTILAVVYFDSTGSIGNIFSHTASNDNPRFQFSRVNASGNTQKFSLNYDSDPITNYVISNVDVGSTSKKLLEATFNTSQSSLYLNGAACGSGFGVTLDGAYDSYIGGSGPYSSPYKIGEVIIYNRVLTTPERQQVEAYLNAKYAIY